jgi:uncharacterized repeat protein (TIGR01451 family)
MKSISLSVLDIIVVISLVLLALPATTLAQEPLPPRPDDPENQLPPRPEPEPVEQPGVQGNGQSSSHDDEDHDYAPLGSHVALLVDSAQVGLWAVVQWQDGAGNWHDVEGWQGELEDGAQDWWVASRDFGAGPFRWVVYQDQGKSTVLAESQAFELPSGPDESVRVSLSPVAPNPTATPEPPSLPAPASSPALRATVGATQVDLTVSPEVVQPGQVVTVTWKLVFSNLTSETLRGVTVRDPLPGGLNYVSSRSTQGNVGLTGDTVVANLGDVAPGGRVEILIDTTVSGDAVPGSTYTNQATASTTKGSPVTSTTATVTVGGMAIMPETGGLLESPATHVVVSSLIALGLAVYLQRRRSRKVCVVPVREGRL